MNTRPSVTISLSPLLESYCRLIFGTDPNVKEIALRKNYDIAKLIHSNVYSCDTPDRRAFINTPVTFILPVDKVNHRELQFHFLHVHPWGSQKIVEGIEYEFRRWITQRFDKGYDMGYSQKIIVEAIVRGLNVRNTAANFDAIKKIDYRNRRKTEERRFDELLRECQTFE